MDGLLLLCNLHAEGPSTWRRLRSRGVTRPSDLTRIPIDRLAEFLGVSPALARRFLREAAVFGARTAFDAHPGVERESPPTVGRPEPEPLARSEDECVQGAAQRSTGPSERLGRVRALPLDELAPRTALRPPVIQPLHEPRFARPALAIGQAPPARRTLPVSPAPTTHREPGPVGSETLLRAGLVGELDTQSCEKLIGEGIRTLGQLARAPLTRLAQCAGIAEAALAAWQGGAQKLLERQRTEDTRTHAAEPEYELIPHRPPAPPRPVWTPEPELDPAHRSDRCSDARAFAYPRRVPHRSDREGVGGPFA